MYYAGIDLHKKYLQVSVNDKLGRELVNQRLACQKEGIREFFASFDQPVSSVIEATANWPWLVRLLNKQNISVCLAHPLKTKAIASAKIKTDSIDAKILADLLRANLIPQSYLPTDEEQTKRDLLRFRINLVKQKTQLKNRIHSVLSKQNIKPPLVTDLFGKTGRRFIGKITKGNFTELTSQEKMLINEYLSLIDTLELKIGKINKIIKKNIKDDPQAQLLLTVPGFGFLTASMLSAELGSIKRFRNDKQIVGYVGLAPRTYSSGDKTRRGGITKTGNPYLRWILVQAAHRAIKKDPYLKLFYAGIAKRRGKKKAIVAVARKLLTSCYFMIKKYQPYQFREIRIN